ncbi:MAG: efflux RND transporter periplasmic adaptor subunit [Candidatus Cloacimonadota bacterium]|nr:efflux RND transporter periplasmic adaptor subunit [Candidatus Cloacimonadota bacterium]
MKKFTIVVAIIIIIVVLFAVFGKNGEKTTSKQPKIEKYVVDEGDITIKLEETGEIKPIKEIEIKSKVSGKILKFYVEEGDYVDKGDVIADVEPDYNQAQEIARVNSNLRLAEIRLENAEEELQKVKQLYENNYISSEELDDAEDNLVEAKLNYEMTLQQYNLIKEIETTNNISKIIATASGTVIQKQVEEGEMVVSSTNSYSAGTVIFKVADLNRMIVETNINEVDISKISNTKRVDILVDAYPYSKYHGELIKIAAMAIEYNNVKVFPVEIEIMDVDEKLKPGMTANVSIIGQEKEDILVVPIRAIFSNQNGEDIVYKVKNDSIAGDQLVKTGINDFQMVEIVEGISKGDTISLTKPIMDKNNMNFGFH